MDTAVTAKDAIDRVLIVEDIPRDASLLKGIIQEDDSKVKVVVAHTLSTAVEQVKKDAFSVILLDMDLPDSVGLRSLDILYEKTRTPIVIVTDTKEEEFFEAIQIGAVDCWRKDQVDLMKERFVISLKVAVARRKYTDYRHELATVFQRGTDSLSKIVVEGMGGLCLAEILNS